MEHLPPFSASDEARMVLFCQYLAADRLIPGIPDITRLGNSGFLPPSSHIPEPHSIGTSYDWWSCRPLLGMARLLVEGGDPLWCGVCG